MGDIVEKTWMRLYLSLMYCRVCIRQIWSKTGCPAVHNTSATLISVWWSVSEDVFCPENAQVKYQKQQMKPAVWDVLSSSGIRCSRIYRKWTEEISPKCLCQSAWCYASEDCMTVTDGATLRSHKVTKSWSLYCSTCHATILGFCNVFCHEVGCFLIVTCSQVPNHIPVLNSLLQTLCFKSVLWGNSRRICTE